MKRIIFSGAIIALFSIVSCSKDKDLEQELKKSSIAKNSEELSGKAGWDAMNEFRSQKDNYPTEFDDVSPDKALFLMETTFNYDHGNFSDTSIALMGIDTLLFSVETSATGEVVGTSLLEAYIELEESLTTFESGETILIFVDFEFRAYSGDNAHYRAIRFSGQTRSQKIIHEAKPMITAQCWPNTDHRPGYEQVNSGIILVAIGVNPTQYLSNIITDNNLEVDGRNDLWVWGEGAGHIGCMDIPSFTVGANDHATTRKGQMTGNTQLFSAWLTGEGPSGTNYQYHLLNFKTAKLNESTTY
ncbi:MAG: hypothetical protein H0X62_13895 [Bacteroidetes bacterium]|nr:hypothetical protein [Bacteroidota bacterium]